MKTTLILGGARSGKSSLAQEIAARSGGPVLYVATAQALDEEMKDRIEAHRRDRSPEWRTLEVTTGAGRAITRELQDATVVIIDCITLLVNNVFEANHGGADAVALDTAVSGEIKGLIDCIRKSNARFIIVSNEVGLGIVPADPVSRVYRDLLGKANRMLAQHADEVLLMVAGLIVTLKG